MADLRHLEYREIEPNFCPECGSQEFYTIGSFDGSVMCAGCGW